MESPRQLYSWWRASSSDHSGGASMLSALTVGEWLPQYIDHLTGVEKLTVSRYRAYARNDIVPVLGAIPLGALSGDDVARWVQRLEGSGKTIRNKHGFLSSALKAAVKGRADPVQSRRRAAVAGHRACRHGVPVARRGRQAARQRHRVLAPAGRVPRRLGVSLGRGDGTAT